VTFRPIGESVRAAEETHRKWLILKVAVNGVREPPAFAEVDTRRWVYHWVAFETYVKRACEVETDGRKDLHIEAGIE